MIKPKIYLAHDLLFSKIQRDILLPIFVNELEQLGLTVYEPWERNNIGVDRSMPGANYKIGQDDKADVTACDAILVILNAALNDGVIVELGFAIAQKKQIFFYCDDFRKDISNTSTNDYPFNLMTFSGSDQQNWKDSFFTDINQIRSPDKFLYHWVKNFNNQVL